MVFLDVPATVFLTAWFIFTYFQIEQIEFQFSIYPIAF